MAKRFKWLLLLVFPLSTLAQSLQTDTLRPVLNHRPRWVIKAAPLALFDIDNTIQAGAEWLLGRRYSVQAELGYGWRGINLYPDRRDDYEKFEVWRGRAEWRRYSGRYRGFRKPHFAVPPIGRYFALETFFKQVTTLQTTTIGQECVDGTCAYFQRGTFPMYRTVWGIHAKFGRQYVLTMPSDNRFLLDFFVGLGFRHLTPYRFSTTSEDVFEFTNTGLWSRHYQGILPSATIGIKLGYVL
ncbi:hypothetical protein ACFPMF_05625 [Larkinella bovis]|uniref:DUF3575 domain-containing protein n=1 Tax=Larkinella bovis TaxID=683041 RepID=A0ABW0I5H5_9BACT